MTFLGKDPLAEKAEIPASHSAPPEQNENLVIDLTKEEDKEDDLDFIIENDPEKGEIWIILNDD